MQISALGTGDGSSARFPSIYQDLFGNRTFDNRKVVGVTTGRVAAVYLLSRAD
jgi:hypothetical protein